MNTRFLIIAHAPLASALRQCVLHVFPDAAQELLAVDVHPHVPPEETLETVQHAVRQLGGAPLLVLTDLFGATPCNVAQKIVDGVDCRLIAGVNLPMLLRAVTYRKEPLDAVVARALSGGNQGVMTVAITAPQNQARKNHDQVHYDHQQ